MSVFSRQALRGRIGDEETLRHQIGALETERNEAGATIDWLFRSEDASRQTEPYLPGPKAVKTMPISC